MKTTYFKDCKTLDEVKTMYKKLALEHHPDRGGDTATMQALNAEYEAITRDPAYLFSKQKQESQQDYKEFPDIIEKVIAYRDITIEMCGNWIWLSGATYRHREELKKAGFLFAHEKKLWYWRPHDYKSLNRKPQTIEYIRSKYGSDVFTPPSQKELEAQIK